MKILTELEWRRLSSEGWFSKVPYRLPDRWYNEHFSYAFEKDTVAKPLFPVARFVGSAATRTGRALGVLSSLRVWKPAHDTWLIQAVFKEAFAYTMGLPPDGTFISAERGESESLAALVHLAMLFGWDFEVYCEEPALQIQISHDGIIDFFTSSQHDGLMETFSRETARHPKLHRSG